MAWQPSTGSQRTHTERHPVPAPRNHCGRQAHATFVTIVRTSPKGPPQLDHHTSIPSSAPLPRWARCNVRRPAALAAWAPSACSPPWHASLPTPRPRYVSLRGACKCTTQLASKAPWLRPHPLAGDRPFALTYPSCVVLISIFLPSFRLLPGLRAHRASDALRARESHAAPSAVGI